MPSFGELVKGQQAYQTTGELLALKWMDKREVHMITTLHEPAMVETEKSDRATGRKIKKPLCIVKYNENMRAVDQVDIQISFSECLRKTVKWYKKLFFHLFDITVQNTYAMFKMNNERNVELLEFRLQLARELIEEYGSKRPQMIADHQPTTHYASLLVITSLLFQEIMFKDAVSSVVIHSSEKKKRSDTRFYCPDCDVPLCNPNCFKVYHSLKAC